MKNNRTLYGLLIAVLLNLSPVIHADEDMEGMRFMIEMNGITPPEVVIKTVKAGLVTGAVVTLCFVGWKYRRNILKDLTILKNDTSQIMSDTSILKKDATEIKDIVSDIKKDTFIIERDVKKLQSSMDTHASTIKQRLFDLYRRFIKMNKDIDGIRSEGAVQITKIDAIHQKVGNIEKKQDEMLALLKKIAQRSEL